MREGNKWEAEGVKRKENKVRKKESGKRKVVVRETMQRKEV